VYRNAVAAGTWTGPSHASLLTGLLPSVHGVHYAGEDREKGIFTLDPAVPTLATHLGAHGYRTAAFVGNDSYLDPVFGMNRGFERYRHKGMRPAGKLVAAVREWLGRRRGRSVFLFLNVMDAHEPYEAPPPYDRLFPGRLERSVERHPGDRALTAGQLPDGAATAHYISQYDGELRYIDDRLDELFQELRALGRYDNALIVITSDHGELFGEHGHWGHGGEPVRELVHVPLIVKYPQNVRRGVEEKPVSLVDVAPTILATLGLPPLAAGQVTLEQRSTPVVAEDIASGRATRAVYHADGQEHIGHVAAASPLHQGPIVFPEADRRLARRLRALGYVQ
jgi:arylsulfatase A-like enzyme